MRKLLLSIILFLNLNSLCFGVTEFVSIINKTGEDYNTLTLWEAAMDNVGSLTDGTAKTGNWDNRVGSNIADAITVGWDAGETGNATPYFLNSLIDSGALFLSSGVATGDLVMNTTDGTSATVVSITNNTKLNFSTNLFDNGNEAYEIYWSYGTLIHMTTTQYLVDVLNGSLADNDTVIDISNNSFDIAGTPDSAIITAEIYNDDGTLNESVAIDGFTANSTNYVKITVPSAERHGGLEGVGAAITMTSGANSSIRLVDTNVILEWMDITCSIASASDRSAVFVNAANCIVRNNVIHDVVNTDVTGKADGIDVSTSGGGVYILDNIIYKSEKDGIESPATINSTIYNNTCYLNSDNGIDIPAGTGTVDVQNNLCIGNTNGDYAGTYDTFSKCGSGDATGSEAGLQSLVATTEWTDPTGTPENLHLKSGAVSIDAGNDLLTTNGVNFDIDGKDRDADADIWDLGADEFVSVGVVRPMHKWYNSYDMEGF